MSSIFSDPGWRRGTTLCSGDLSGTGTGNDLPGAELVGQIKAFQDVHPRTGARNSNRLVYCQAVRWKGATVEDGSTVAGRAFTVDLVLENGKAFATITNPATNANATNGREVGVVDEYLTGRLAYDDVVWLVRKGPTSIKQFAAIAIANGSQVELTGATGKVALYSTGHSLGVNILGADSPATVDALVRINLIADDI